MHKREYLPAMRPCTSPRCPWPHVATCLAPRPRATRSCRARMNPKSTPGVAGAARTGSGTMPRPRCRARPCRCRGLSAGARRLRPRSGPVTAIGHKMVRGRRSMPSTLPQDFSSVYGPVASWRYGRSLGIDPIGPVSACSFDCVYCQLGEIEEKTRDRRIFVATSRILRDLRAVAVDGIDVISLSGSGEPTLALNLGEIVSAIKAATGKPVVVLTNASLLGDPGVRQEAGACGLCGGQGRCRRRRASSPRRSPGGRNRVRRDPAWPAGVPPGVPRPVGGADDAARPLAGTGTGRLHRVRRRTGAGRNPALRTDPAPAPGPRTRCARRSSRRDARLRGAAPQGRAVAGPAGFFRAPAAGDGGSGTRPADLSAHGRPSSAMCADAERSSADEGRGLVRSGGARVRRGGGGRRLRNPGRAGPRQRRRDCGRPAAGPVRHGVADQLRHFQGRLGGPPGAGDPRPGARRRHGLLGQFLRRPQARARGALLHRRPDDQDPEEGVPVRDDVVARRKGLVRPRLRRDLQAIRHRRARLRRAGRREGGAGRLLQAHQRRLSRPRAGTPNTTTARSSTTTCASTAPRPSARDSGSAPGTRTSRSRARRLLSGGKWWRPPTPTFPPRWR